MYDIVGLHPNCEVADIGAGTGVFSKLLLEQGSHVIAVEPNREMREVAEKNHGGERNFRVVSGSAEETELPDQSVDFIVCAQAFHWFDRSAAQSEFKRILKLGGKVVLIWNSRLTYGTPFREEYDLLLHTFGTDYKQVNHQNITSEILAAFFQPGAMKEARFTNRQTFDFEGLRGRLLSSYSPTPEDPGYEPMLKELRNVFERNQKDGKVNFDYETEVYWGAV